MTYHDLFLKLTATETDDDSFYYCLDAMSFQKRATGYKPKWKDPVPDYIYIHLERKFHVRLS